MKYFDEIQDKYIKQEAKKGKEASIMVKCSNKLLKTFCKQFDISLMKQKQ